MPSPSLSEFPINHLAMQRFLSTQDYSHKYVTGFLGLIIAGTAILWLWPTQNQKYIVGVPIVGGHDDASIKRNRIRFVTDSKRMLQEGYEQVGDVFPGIRA